jgi:predicted nucleic acid-binding protein
MPRMIIPDVNLLLYAEIDAFPKWWERTLSGRQMGGIPAGSLFGLVRIAANRRVFVEPLTSRTRSIECVHGQNARASASLPLGQQPRDRVRRSASPGNLTSDAQFAAHAIEH